MNLYFLHNYNNYFNRRIKPTFNYQTLRDFELENSDYDAAYITGVQFAFNDCVETTQIVNWDKNWSPDYMILCYDNETIHSTWFVLDSYYQRNGQFNLTLRRDVVNDYYENIMEAPTYIEKATIGDINNPLLYNSENMAFNQIKQKEHQLFDSTGCGWIVGYVSKPETDEEDVQLNASVNLGANYILNNLPFEKDAIIHSKPTQWQLNVAMGYLDPDGHVVGSSRSYNFYGENLENNGPIAYTKIGTDYLAPYIDYPLNIDAFDELLLSKLNVWKQSMIADFETDALLYNGKIVYDTIEDKYYRIKVINEGTAEIKTSYMKNDPSASAVALKFAIDLANGKSGSGAYMGDVSYTTTKYRMSFVEMPNANLASKISKSRKGLVDAPYDMFAIPYGRIMIAEKATSLIPLGITNAEAALNIAQDIPRELGSKLYDIQLLPYCPCPEYLYNDTLILEGLTEDVHYNKVATFQSLQSIILWCTTSSRTFKINHNYFVREPKIENECDMWRIVSPNYQGMFEFSAAKNGGINGFTVDYTYKPYNPYIHVAPVWDNLYGSNFGDARGLICGGDFSLPQTSDAFTQYEINNKNYQNIFDRGIQNLEVNRKYQRIQEGIGAFAGSVQTSAMGFMIGGGAGATAGGVAGLGAGIADAAMSEAQYKENKAYQTDLYNYNLGNIKAQPDSITKSSALTINNKIVPILEHYSCTEKEKEVLRNKLKYNGMTVMAIGQLKDYLLPEETFVQGQIIRIDAAEDTHMANVIYNELKKGVYTTAVNLNSEE